MIDYATFCQLQVLHREKHLTVAQIAAELKLDPRSVAKWVAQSSYQKRKETKRPSKLDSFKGQIVALLERHPYSAQQVLQQLKSQGYSGGYSILKKFVRLVRPVRKPAFLMLEFAAGECAQVDWGSYGSIAVGTTRRRLSFFVMVLCHSRLIYPDQLFFYHHEKLIATHLRSYDRRQDIRNPDHIRELLVQRQRACEQTSLQAFLSLGPQAEFYARTLHEKRVNAPHHIQNIVALSQIYGPDKVARALEAAVTFEAFGCEYIANLLEQGQRPVTTPSPLHLTRRQDLLDLELPAADLTLYDLKPKLPQL